MRNEWPRETKAFTLTNWNVDCDYQQMVADKKIRFIAYGEETCPTTGKAHHQAFVYFHKKLRTNNRSLLKIASMFGEKVGHAEPMVGGFQANEVYCSKESALTKVGDEPKQGMRGDIEEVRDMILRGEVTSDDVCVENPEFWHQYGRTMDRLETIAYRKKFRTWMTKGVWYTGPTGAGKSHRVFEGYDPETHYVKNLQDEWWDGYKGQSIVIFNEFRGQIKFSELLDLMDKYPKTVKQRNREPVPFLAEEIRIASIKTPDEVYSCACLDSEPFAQFQRRCITIKLNKRPREE